MRTGAIIQARMGSTRLPGKVLMDIAGETMLGRVVGRVRRTGPLLDEVIVATTELEEDDAILRECKALDVPVYRGSSTDVLDRYVRAARVHQLDVVVRITADCPLIDPGVITLVVERFRQASPDYASNTLVRTYPRGLDTEVVSISALEQAWREADQEYEREHVTPYLYEHPNLFQLLSVELERGDNGHFGDLRWTVDTPEDLALIRALYNRIDGERATWEDVLAVVRQEPELSAINRHVSQKPLRGVLSS